MATNQKQTSNSLPPEISDEQRIKNLQDTLIHQVSYTSIVLENHRDIIKHYKAQKALMAKMAIAFANDKRHSEFMDECTPDELGILSQLFTDQTQPK